MADSKRKATVWRMLLFGCIIGASLWPQQIWADYGLGLVLSPGIPAADFGDNNPENSLAVGAEVGGQAAVRFSRLGGAIGYSVESNYHYYPTGESFNVYQGFYSQFSLLAGPRVNIPMNRNWNYAFEALIGLVTTADESARAATVHLGYSLGLVFNRRLSRSLLLDFHLRFSSAPAGMGDNTAGFFGSARQSIIFLPGIGITYTF